MRTVEQGTVKIDDRLRSLLRAGRRGAGNLSQKDAAERAGISEIYWQKIESGRQPTAPADTLAAMLAVTPVTPEQLRESGFPAIAEDLAELRAMGKAVWQAADPEQYLAETPGASAEEITALQAVWRALRAGRTPEPFEQDFQGTTRQGDDT